MGEKNENKGDVCKNSYPGSKPLTQTYPNEKQKYPNVINTC